MSMLADGFFERITADEAIAALTAQAFHVPYGEDDYERAVLAIRVLCQRAFGGVLEAQEVRAELDQALGEQRVIVHCMMGGVGADWDLGPAVALVRDADEVGWCQPFMGHDLVVAARGKVYNFQVAKNPEAGR